MMKRKKTKRKASTPRVERTRNANNWTEAMYFQRIRSALRQAFRFWKPAMIALENAARPYRGPKKQQKKEYQCAECKKWFPRREVEIDHVVECGSLSTYEDIIEFLKRLTPESHEAYKVMCKPCHKKKTEAYKQSKSKSNDKAKGECV
jgi:hypothetical protein